MVWREYLNVLLDTHVFLWLTAEPDKLSRRAVELLEDSSSEIYLSSVSVWEIVVKHSKGRLSLPEDPKIFIPRARTTYHVTPLALKEESALIGSRLPWHHQDPFDRMLICQALSENLTILTADRQIRKYAVQTVW